MTDHKKSRTGPEQDPAPSGETAQPVRSGRKGLLLFLGLLCAGVVVLWSTRPGSGREGEKGQPDPPREALTADGLQQEVLDVGHQLLAEFPDDLDPPGLMGLACSKLGRYAEAVKWYQRALELNPNLPQAHFMMAEAAINRGEFDLAAERCRKALAIHPSMPGVNGRLGQMLMELGRPEEAVEAFKTELRHHPDASWYEFPLGQAYLQLQEYEKALPHLEKSAKSMPDFPLAHYAMGRAHMRLGDPEKAAECNKKFKKLRDAQHQAGRDERKDDFDLARVSRVAATIHTGAGQVYAGKGQMDNADEHWRRAALLDERNLLCRRLLSESCLRRQRWSEALELYQQLLRFDPDNAGYHLNRGIALFYLRDLVDAEKSIRQSLRLAPGNPAGYHSLVQVLSLGEQRLPEARAAAERLVGLAPTAENYGILSELCRRSGDEAGARAAMERALELGPGGM